MGYFDGCSKEELRAMGLLPEQRKERARRSLAVMRSLGRPLSPADKRLIAALERAKVSP